MEPRQCSLPDRIGPGRSQSRFWKCDGLGFRRRRAHHRIDGRHIPSAGSAGTEQQKIEEGEHHCNLGMTTQLSLVQPPYNSVLRPRFAIAHHVLVVFAALAHVFDMQGLTSYRYTTSRHACQSSSPHPHPQSHLQSSGTSPLAVHCHPRPTTIQLRTCRQTIPPPMPLPVHRPLSTRLGPLSTPLYAPKFPIACG